jgi:hypothetical protein
MATPLGRIVTPHPQAHHHFQKGAGLIDDVKAELYSL